MNFEKLKKILVTVLLAFLSLHIFVLDIEMVTLNNSNTTMLYDFFQGLFLSMKPIRMQLIVIFILFYSFFYKSFFDTYKNDTYKKDKFSLRLSCILSLGTIGGSIYGTMSSSLEILFCSFLQIYKFIILFLGYFIIYYAILKRICSIDFKNFCMKETAFEIVFRNHTLLATSLILIVFFLPLSIIFYPGGATGDTADSVYQFFHSDGSWSIQTINLIDNDVYINKHHSVLFTVTLGSFLKFGNYICSYNFGFFLFILFQVCLVISSFDFMIYYMKKNKIPFYLILFSIFFIILSPFIVKYTLTAVKDTLNAIFNLIYVIFLVQIVRNYNSIFRNKFRLFILIVVMLLVMLFRNNGIYTITLSFPFLFILYKKKWKKLLKVFGFVLIVFGIYDNILLPSFGVSDGSIREVLSVPFMQVARVAKYHGEEFSQEEKDKINKVLDFDNIVNGYNPRIADDVKNNYKMTATRQDLLVFFAVWFKYLKKYPIVYIDSFLNSTYGYFYPAFVEDDPKILFTNFLAYEDEFELGPVPIFNVPRAIVNYLLSCACSSPFFIWFNNVGISNLILIFSFIYIFKNKKYKYLIPLCPLISVLLVCLFSPVNGCVRYVLPIFVSIPIILSIDYLVYHECCMEKEKKHCISKK